MRAEFVFTEKKIKERVVIPMYRWSNLSVKDQLHGLLIGGEGKPRFVSLARNQCSAATQMKEQGDLTYERQMSAEIRMESKGKPYWEKLRPNNHYWDLACMRVVRMAMDNLLGHEAAIDQSSTAVGDSTP